MVRTPQKSSHTPPRVPAQKHFSFSLAAVLHIHSFCLRSALHALPRWDYIIILLVLQATHCPVEWSSFISLLRSATHCHNVEIDIVILQATYCPARLFLHSLPPTHCCRSSAEFIMNFTSATLQSWHRSVTSFFLSVSSRGQLVTPLRVLQLTCRGPPFRALNRIVPSPVSHSLRLQRSPDFPCTFISLATKRLDFFGLHSLV